MALLFNLKGDFCEDTSFTFFLSSMFFFKQIRKVFVFKGSAYILDGNFFFFLAEDFSWISFLN